MRATLPMTGSIASALRVGALLVTFALTTARAQTPTNEPVSATTARFDLLDNGDFAATNDTVKDESGKRPIAWWRSSNGMDQIEAHGGGMALRTCGDEWAEQPVAAYAPHARTLEIQGRVAGRGRVTIEDGSGASASFDFSGSEDAFTDFTIRGEELAAKLGKEPAPRFTVRLAASEPNARALWRSLAVRVDLPCPSEERLRAEVLEHLHWIFDVWLARGRDDLGPRATGFICKSFDVITGEPLGTIDAGLFPLFAELLTAWRAEDVPHWREALERFIDDYLTLCIEPATGLPRTWDPIADQPIRDRPVEIALTLDFLIDVADHGPEKLRDRARAAAVKIGETVLAKGLLPDGDVAVKYFPIDGRVDTNVNQLHRFDVPHELARLSKLTGDPRYVHEAREALSAFEFTHVWQGTWDAIDPGFDDNFGNYGARAAKIALVDPSDPLFRRFALEGFRHYAPLWREALALGGNVAADQVRCWSLCTDLVRVEPATKDEARELLHMAARSHFKGEQYGNGAWGDVTIYRFDPKSNLQVGDLPGAPQNLLNGLASIYDDDLGLRTDELRALYTAVMRSTFDTYGRKYGVLMERRERVGQNPAWGSIRVLLGLSKMLRQLTR